MSAMRGEPETLECGQRVWILYGDERWNKFCQYGFCKRRGFVFGL